MKKYVYMFPEGNGKMRELLGGKGANLAEMTGLGMPVPQGFTITTEACTRYYEDGKTIYPDIQDQILLYLDQLEKITGKTLGDPEKPLLVSVRSGARASMPGMMDTRVSHATPTAVSFRCSLTLLWSCLSPPSNSLSIRLRTKRA